MKEDKEGEGHRLLLLVLLALSLMLRLTLQATLTLLPLTLLPWRSQSERTVDQLHQAEVGEEEDDCPTCPRDHLHAFSLATTDCLQTYLSLAA